MLYTTYNPSLAPPVPEGGPHRRGASCRGEGPAISTTDAAQRLEETTIPEYLALKGEPVEFRALIRQVTYAAKRVAAELRTAGLDGMLGATGGTNVQGEKVQRLDEYANMTFVTNLLRSPSISDLVSEEMSEGMHLAHHNRGDYALLFDPIDGSSNLDVDMAVGSIFSVRRSADVLAAGHSQIAAGYVLYGPSCICVLAMPKYGVNCFVLDPSIGEFLFTRGPLLMPEQGGTYGCNEGNESSWSPALRDYVRWLRGEGGHSTRYSGALVGDFHRILLQGGVYLYPADAKHPDGKLRLLYEAAPLAFIAKIAGGRGTSETMDILDIVPSKIHQRVPLVVGSRAEVDKLVPPRTR